MQGEKKRPLAQVYAYQSVRVLEHAGERVDANFKTTGVACFETEVKDKKIRTKIATQNLACMLTKNRVKSFYALISAKRVRECRTIVLSMTNADRLTTLDAARTPSGTIIDQPRVRLPLSKASADEQDKLLSRCKTAALSRAGPSEKIFLYFQSELRASFK